MNTVLPSTCVPPVSCVNQPRNAYVLSEDQMSLFNEAESCQDHKAEEPAEETFTVKAHARPEEKENH